MKTIYKYEVPSRGFATMMPEGARILSVGEQGGGMFVWAIVDSEQSPTVPRRLRVYGTGHPMPDEPGKFLGTIHVNDGGSPLVFHVFEEGGGS